MDRSHAELGAEIERPQSIVSMTTATSVNDIEDSLSDVTTPRGTPRAGSPQYSERPSMDLPPPSYDESQAVYQGPREAWDQRSGPLTRSNDITVYRTETSQNYYPPHQDSVDNLNGYGVDDAFTTQDGSEPMLGDQPRASALLYHALGFTNTPAPPQADNFISHLSRPVAVPSISSDTSASSPAQFARLYARILQTTSVTAAQFASFIDGLNAVCTASAFSSAHLHASTPFRFEAETPHADVPREEWVRAYIQLSNCRFFAPRGLRMQITTLKELAELAKLPELRGFRREMCQAVLETSQNGHGVSEEELIQVARETAIKLEPYIEPLTRMIPATSQDSEAMQRIANGLANFDITEKPPVQTSRQSTETNQGYTQQEHGSTPKQNKLWTPFGSLSLPGPSHLQPSTSLNGPNGPGALFADLGEEVGRRMGQWGEGFGRRMGQWGKEYGEAVQGLGNEINKKTASHRQQQACVSRELLRSNRPGSKNAWSFLAQGPCSTVLQQQQQVRDEQQWSEQQVRDQQQWDEQQTRDQQQWNERQHRDGQQQREQQQRDSKQQQQQQNPQQQDEEFDWDETASIASSYSSSSSSSSDSDETLITSPSDLYAAKVLQIEEMATKARSTGKKDELSISRDRATALQKASEEKTKRELRLEKRLRKRALKHSARIFKRQMHAWGRGYKREVKNAKKGRMGPSEISEITARKMAEMNQLQQAFATTQVELSRMDVEHLASLRQSKAERKAHRKASRSQQRAGRARGGWHAAPVGHHGIHHPGHAMYNPVHGHAGQQTGIHHSPSGAHHAGPPHPGFPGQLPTGPFGHPLFPIGGPRRGMFGGGRGRGGRWPGMYAGYHGRPYGHNEHHAHEQDRSVEESELSRTRQEDMLWIVIRSIEE